MEMGVLDVNTSHQSSESWMEDGLHHSGDSTCGGAGAAGQGVKGPLSIPEIPLKTKQSWKQPLFQKFLPSAATRTSEHRTQVGFRSDGTPASSYLQPFVQPPARQEPALLCLLLLLLCRLVLVSAPQQALVQ